jgi:undecaprenyl-diphosphatase
MTLIQSIIIAIIEGITEFLPVSSTGHMILASRLMHIHEDEFVKTFEIVIQLGAIMAIVLMYIKRFLRGISIYLKLGIAFIPTAIAGFLAYPYIKAYLFNPIIVAVSLIVGGIVLIIIDRRVISRKSQVDVLENISYRNAFFIGLIQIVSMIPGVSRAAATIIGGVFNGLDKKQATEFSFLLAVPTMFAAAGYDLLKTEAILSKHEIVLLIIGFFIAMITAWFAVKIFLKIVENYGFKHFGYYRIVIGVVFLLVLL